jgi:hypothetical protein
MIHAKSRGLIHKISTSQVGRASGIEKETQRARAFEVDQDKFNDDGAALLMRCSGSSEL